MSTVVRGWSAIVILSAMRPREPSYAALELPGGAGIDASLDFVIADAPVTNSYARYLAAVTDGRIDIVERHHLYWTTDEAAIDGNPTLILDRAEPVELPPLLITQGTADQSVPMSMTRRFVDCYRRAGGEVQFRTFEDLGHGFILQDPSRAESVQQAETVVAFIRDCTPSA